jgi:CubicO group peptidase (beta-lactamase class C family)
MSPSPEALGLDARRLTTAVDVLRDAIDQGAMPGCVVRCLRRGEVFLDVALGTLDGRRPTARDTIYDLASLTKPIATASSVLTLVEHGRLALNASPASLLPDVPESLAAVTVHHLLTHTSGLPAHCRLWEQSAPSHVSAILGLPCAPAGTKYEYSCLGFILLGRIVEALTGQALDAFAGTHVFEPLGLTDTTYRPPASLHPRIAPTRSLETALPTDQPDRDLLGVVHDGNARSMAGVSGNAGLFGTAADVARFGQAILAGELFSRPTTARILQSQVDPKIGGHTLMFFAPPNPLCPAGDLLSPRAVGHSGYTGTLLAIDPEYDLVAVVLSNRVYTDADGSKWLPARRRFMNALAAAIRA